MQLYLMKCKYPLALSLMQFGYEKCDSHHSFGPVIRDFYVLHYVLSGRGSLLVEGVRYDLNPGDFFLVPKGREVKYWADPNDPYEYVWIGFAGTSDTEVLAEAGFTDGAYVLHRAGDDSKVRAIFERGRTIVNGKNVRDASIVSSILYEILSLLMPVEDGEEASEEEMGLRAVVDYIEANYCDVTIAKLEKLSAMHRSNLYRLFMRRYHMPPSEYIQNVRLEKSLYLLKNTDFSVKQIASMTGWKESAYFCKVFKTHFKKTPSEARMLK